MGRTYAGILGTIAFLTVLGRGLIHGAEAVPTLRLASASLLVMAVLGAIVGRLAAWLIDQSIRWQVQGELEARQPAGHRARAPAGPTATDGGVA